MTDTGPTAATSGESRHRSIYRSMGNVDIILDVPEPPMGSGSGFIPPPIIEFFRNGAQVQFVYAGEVHDDHSGGDAT